MHQQRNTNMASSLLQIPAKLGGMLTLKELYLNGSCGRKVVVVPAEITARGILQDCYEGQI